MSALALILHNMGYKVQGSDQETYFFTQRGLEKAGIELLPFNAEPCSPYSARLRLRHSYLTL